MWTEFAVIQQTKRNLFSYFISFFSVSYGPSVLPGKPPAGNKNPDFT